MVLYFALTIPLLQVKDAGMNQTASESDKSAVVEPWQALYSALNDGPLSMACLFVPFMREADLRSAAQAVVSAHLAGIAGIPSLGDCRECFSASAGPENDVWDGLSSVRDMMIASAAAQQERDRARIEELEKLASDNAMAISGWQEACDKATRERDALKAQLEAAESRANSLEAGFITPVNATPSLKKALAIAIKIAREAGLGYVACAQVRYAVNRVMTGVDPMKPESIGGLPSPHPFNTGLADAGEEIQASMEMNSDEALRSPEHVVPFICEHCGHTDPGHHTFCKTLVQGSASPSRHPLVTEEMVKAPSLEDCMTIVQSYHTRSLAGHIMPWIRDIRSNFLHWHKKQIDAQKLRAEKAEVEAEEHRSLAADLQGKLNLANRDIDQACSRHNELLERAQAAESKLSSAVTSIQWLTGKCGVKHDNLHIGCPQCEIEKLRQQLAAVQKDYKNLDSKTSTLEFQNGGMRDLDAWRVKEIESLRSQLSKAGQWVSVSERLPTKEDGYGENNRVLVSYKDSALPMSVRCVRDGLDPASYWMPIPPLPSAPQADKPEPKVDPYAELKAAHAAGKVIEITDGAGHWLRIEDPEWDCVVKDYRIKPEPWQPKFRIGDYVTVTDRPTPCQITGINVDEREYLLGLGSLGRPESELTWVLSNSINGHTLAPGQAWHRQDWTQDMLPDGYRPLTLDEVQQEGDQFYDMRGGWVDLSCPVRVAMVAQNSHRRTLRPLPNPLREEFEKVWNEVISLQSRYTFLPVSNKDIAWLAFQAGKGSEV